MQQHSRREFLAGSAGLALSAGLLPLGQVRAADAQAEMVVAKWGGAKDLDDAGIDKAAGKMVRQTIEALGGMKRFVRRGDVVWVKPNIGWDRRPEQAANTNPETVVALIQMCLDAGAKVVKVGDNPVHPAQKCYENSGIAAAAKAAGAEVLFLDRSRFRKTAIGGQRVKEIPIFPAILESDVVINCPLVKHHRLAKLTMCMKNYMGVIESRQVFHQDLPTCIADITRFMQPRVKLHLLEGVRVLTANGPSGGRLEDVQVKMTMAAGTDPLALDAWGTELLGQKPKDIGSVAKGQEAGLGKLDYRSIAREITVS